MSKSCTLFPTVRNKNNEIVQSKLFKDLLEYTGNDRQQTVNLYRITKNPSFIERFKDKGSFDENGEPTFKSLLDNTNISKYIPNQNIQNKLNKDIGYFKNNKQQINWQDNTTENYNLLVGKAIDFNNNSPYNDNWVAVLEKRQIGNNSIIAVSVQPKTQERQEEASKMEYNYNLNQRLRQIMNAHGVSDTALTELEKRMGINGVTDFEQAERAANGMIQFIRLADGQRGEEALPEEFAHWALEAMGSNPLADRLINTIVNNDLASQILGDEFEDYNFQYKGDKVALAKEAAGKLIAKHLINNEPIQSSRYKNILQRLIEALKNFFKQFKASDISKAITEADKQSSHIANELINGNLDSVLDNNNIDTQIHKLYQLSSTVKRDKQLLQSILENEVKRLEIYTQRQNSSKFEEKQRLLIDKLQLSIENNNEIQGLYEFLDNALSQLHASFNRLITVDNDSSLTSNEKCRILRDVRNYYYSYKNIMKTIRQAFLEESYLEEVNRYGERVKIALKDAGDLLDNLKEEYTKVAMPIFIDFIKQFMGESITVPFGKYKGKVIKAEELPVLAEEDISLFDRWLDSMADSSSYAVKIMGQAIVKSKERGRHRTIDYRKKIEAAAMKLRQSGITNFDWMFETFPDGNKTGRYISDIDYGLYRSNKRDFYRKMKEKYGNNPVGKDADDYRAEQKAWFEANTEIIDEKRYPKKSIYRNTQYENMNAAQKEFYKTIMDIKQELDSYLPENYTTLTNTIKIRKDLLERVKSSDGIKSGKSQIWEAMKDAFIRRSDDTFFGDKATIKDFEDREVQVLPIYYTKLKQGERENDVSTDVVSTMIAYAAMATEYDEMNSVIHILETGRDLMRDNLEIRKKRGDKPLVEKIKSAGVTIESKVTKSKDSRRIIQRIDDAFEMQVYNRYMADEGTFGNSKIDKAKTANFLNRVSSLNMLGLNLLAGISNVATGSVMMRIESFAGEFFSEKDTVWADKTYGVNILPYMGEIGKRIKTSKLALWQEYFNTLQDFEMDVRHVEWFKNRFTKMFGMSAIYTLNNAGEHWMQNRTSLALANRYKMKAPNGKIVNLWDAMEVAYIDPNNKELGAKLQVKKGYTKEDGTKFTKEDAINFGRKSAKINQRMHGIYNEIDKSAIQKLALGRMAILFRKWIKPSMNRRFKKLTYDFDLDEWTEGYYLTTGRFLTQLAKELKQGEFSIVASWKNLDPRERKNIKRALTEVGHFLLLVGALGLIDWGDKDRPWAEKMLEYQLRRLHTELGAFIPGPQMVNEAFTILKSPSADVKTLENSLNIIGLLNPFNYETFGGEDALLKSGRFEGHSRAYKLFFESPFVPMNKTVYRALNPDESIAFYK